LSQSGSQHTNKNQHYLHKGNKPLLITNSYIQKLLRTTCTTFRGKATFGLKLAIAQIRLEATMHLFLQDVSTAKIMILGRWSSDAFLVYIRPQVLEQTNNMSKEMIHFNKFLDVG
jgi:hypothetical protein